MRHTSNVHTQLGMDHIILVIHQGMCQMDPEKASCGAHPTFTLECAGGLYLLDDAADSSNDQRLGKWSDTRSLGNRGEYTTRGNLH